MKLFKYKIAILIGLTLWGCEAQSHQAQEAIIDIETTAEDLSLFAEHVISTPLYERDLAINPQQNELIYTLGNYKQTKRCLVVRQKKKGRWQNAEILNISGQYQDIEPFYSHDGDRLYFASNRPIYNDTTRNDYNIWYSDRVEDRWSDPVALDSIINSKGDEFFPTLSREGNLFFTASRANGVGKEDIFRAEFVDGTFKSPEPLPAEINTATFEFNAYVNPDENIIIFSSFGRSDGFGGGDLYISRKDKKGQWTASKNLGEDINSNKLDYCPFVDWTSGNFYFTSERATLQDDKIESVEALKQQTDQPLNGFGNIYKVAFGSLE
ncbi:TolB family protein [Winogradskyella arenosi]|uniref:WD40 repeat protein n=1 Tax=Winogradskyella arenosi TaxID=533325 RepID=A0A368ZDK6_9FLAO|nr:exo-alpha-sialidase [Winogradskyella arenosi]RCW91332.1 WD40 repeat protein [Winogradskyella arenosi]